LITKILRNGPRAHFPFKKEKKKFHRKKKGEAHIRQEWDSDYSSSDYDDEGLATSALNKSSLSPNERHTCLMVKEKKVHTRDTLSTLFLVMRIPMMMLIIAISLRAYIDPK
jgi:hypothetical protein